MVDNLTHLHLQHHHHQGTVINSGRGMSELGVMRNSPDSDCNSNLRGSCLSTASSSQDVDFVQDNSDYQWFLDYGYKDGCGTNHHQHHHTSILSLPETYEAGDNYYDTLSKNMDANLAEADMESFKTEDIHALLTNLPPMCTDHHLSQESNRQGECYAEVSTSLMGKFDLDGGCGSSQGEDSTSMSICKSELLFSPVKEVPMPNANYSVDSLDCDLHDMMLTCQANKDNYTIAFEGSVTMYSTEDSDYHYTDKSSSNSNQPDNNQSGSLDNKNLLNAVLNASMTQSDSSSFTTWSKLKKRSSEDQLRRPSGNNNNSEDENSTPPSYGDVVAATQKSQSMPDLHRQKLLRKKMSAIAGEDDSGSNSSADETVKRRPVKVFDIHHQHHVPDALNASGSSDQKPTGLNLVKLFMKQKSMSQEGMSLTMDQLSSSAENWPTSQSGDSSASDTRNNSNHRHLSSSNEPRHLNDTRIYDLIEEPEKSPPALPDKQQRSCQQLTANRPDDHRAGTKVLDRSMQTSQFSEIANLKHTTTAAAAAPVFRPVKIVPPSFLDKLKSEGDAQRTPVYVLYPNYVLPDLDFLKDGGIKRGNVRCVPQEAPRVAAALPSDRKWPYTLGDFEALKKRGFGHVKDWDSLNALLPLEFRRLLAEVPEVAKHITLDDKERPLFPRTKKRPISCEVLQQPTNNASSSSSTATQPSSGYRGSSTLLTDSQNSPGPAVAAAARNPLFVYRYDSVTSSEASLANNDKPAACITTTPHCPVRCVSYQEGTTAPPRPPLPRGILRKAELSKRFSAYETSEEELANEEILYKRRSVPEPYFLNRHKRLSETEDEGVDAGTSSSSVDEKEIVWKKPEIRQFNQQQAINDELAQLEEFLKNTDLPSGLDDDENDLSLTQLRSYVSKFLTLKTNQEDFGGKKSVSFARQQQLLLHQQQQQQQQQKLHVEAAKQPPNNSPNVSALLMQQQQRNCLKQPCKSVADLTICEENENSPTFTSPQATPLRLCKTGSDNYVQKRSLINGVLDAVEQLMQHFSPASDQQELNELGDSATNPACAKLALTTLCPALYAILSDGLKTCLETSFGAINNSVWQVVEASAQQGPLTKALNDLVMRINSEDAISEGLVKFNAFIFGLLNVRSLDAWMSYLRTRESVLKKHYTADSLLLLSHTSGASLRNMLDTMVAALQPLAFLPFQIDLLFEYKQLHISFKRMDSYHLPPSPIQKERPRSCVEPNFKLGEDVDNVAKKRWSGIALNSKMYQVYDRLTKEDEEYADSLETPKEAPESLDSTLADDKPLNGRRFRKLQQRWEMLSGKEGEKESSSSSSPPPSPTRTAVKSKIPRPITSPVRPSAIPVLVSPPGGVAKSVAAPSPAIKKSLVPPSKAKVSPIKRASRVDQVEMQRDPQRPSSLPYRPANQGGKTTKVVAPQRRAASSSLNRRPLNNGRTNKTTPKVVRALSHRLPSESGHLSYNEGDILKVVLEVDETWLLCCRGTQKGLVPRSAVIAADNERF